MPNIHPSAIISDDAELADDVTVGPFAIIDAGVKIGPGCNIGAQAWITGTSQLGKNNKIGYGSIIGDCPQDLSFDPETPSNVIIGDNNQIREYVTLHRSTSPQGSTVIGNDNFLMIGSHMGHDASLGDHNILANNVLIAGHVKVGNRCFLGGGSGFHQFIQIGDYSIVQGNAAISRDVPPFCTAHGQNKLSGLNTIGLRRGGYNAPARADIKRAYKLIFHSGGNLAQALAEANEQDWTEGAMILIEAVRTPSRKGVISR